MTLLLCTVCTSPTSHNEAGQEQFFINIGNGYHSLPISINANLERQHMRLKKKSLTNTEGLQKRKDTTIGVVCASLVVATVISYISIIALQ